MDYFLFVVVLLLEEHGLGRCGLGQEDQQQGCYHKIAFICSYKCHALSCCHVLEGVLQLAESVEVLAHHEHS